MKEDAGQISALNDVFVAVTSPMNEARFLHLLALSGYCVVAEVDSTVVGFVIAMRSGAPYDNDNYRWFDTRLSEMVYVDRIVLARDSRGRGIAAQLYEHLGELAIADGCCVMTANAVQLSSVMTPDLVALARVHSTTLSRPWTSDAIFPFLSVLMLHDTR